jgi:hypothetical protein
LVVALVVAAAWVVAVVIMVATAEPFIRALATVVTVADVRLVLAMATAA